jgi:hypothetical protein
MAKIDETEAKVKAVGFFKALFDFSFKDFITSKLISFLFGAGVIIGAIATVIAIIGAFLGSSQLGSILPAIVTLFVAPLMYLAGVIVLRILLELTMVIFKIEENTR